VTTEQTVDAPYRAERPSDREPRESGWSTARAWAWRLRWVIGTGAMLVLALLVVLWARTRPGYDPFGWLVWGHLTIHWKLDTNGAPSWKPLPFIFDVPYALIGHRALWLWMVTSVAISLSGPVFAGRIAYRLTGVGAERRWIGWIAGAFAGALVLGIQQYAHFILSSQSDTMIVSLCLAWIDCHLYGRPRWAFVSAVLASMGRPELWPLIGLYAIWQWRQVPEIRLWLYAGLALIPIFWFGIPALTSKSWFTAGDIALKSPRALHQSKILGTIDRFGDLHEEAAYVLAILALGVAFVRREWITLVIAAGALIYVIVEIAFVLHGWPGVPRYLFEPAGVVAVLAGVGVGKILLEGPALVDRFAPRVSSALVTGGAVLIVALFAVWLVPTAHSRLHWERKDLTHERLRTKFIDHLPGLIARLGGTKHLFACGQPTTSIQYQSVLAWDLGSNTGELFWTPHLGKVQPRPVVIFQPTPHAWKVQTINTKPSMRASCQGLNVVSRVIPG
jgi:hypothetical protein